MKFKAILAALPVIFCANAVAEPIYQPPGSNLVYGSSSNNQSIMSSVTNPAAPAAQLSKEDSQYRFGLINLGVGYELGSANDLYNQIDSVKQIMSTPINNTDLNTVYTSACTTPPFDCSAPGEMTAFTNNIVTFVNSSAQVAELNNVILPTLQKDGNASVFFGGHLPLTPLVVSKKNWGGSFVLNANVSAIANMTFIQQPFALNTAAANQLATDFSSYVGAGGNPINYTLPDIIPLLDNDSSMSLKGAAVGELGLGYSRQIFTRDAPEVVEGEPEPGILSASQLKAGTLAAGVRVKYYVVKLARTAERIVDIVNSKDTFDNVNFNYTTSTGIGLDVGTLWTSKHYRAGAWINNINGPSFDYNSIDTSKYSDASVISQINADGTYKMKPQLQLEGAIYSESQNFVANVGLDGNKVQDPVGREFQWATLSAAYATNSWWIPGARVGYRTNLAGSKLSYATAGLTMFKALSLDVAYGLDSVVVDGKNQPRSAMVNLGMQFTF